MKFNPIRLLLICSIIFISACASTSKTENTSPPYSKVQSDAMDLAYKIGVDDQVNVNVWGNPDLSVEMPVRPDGKITIPLIGDVLAAGKEPEEVASKIKKRLSAYVIDPNVTVIISELRSHEFLSRIRVTGAVVNSLSMPFRPGMTVIDAVLEAGGVNEFAAPNRTKLHRKKSSSMKVFDIRLEDVMEDGNLQTNMLLKPGDIITIPERLF